ncbi:cilia- and flagella-associated protein 184-like [Mytilus edulis]|uniref:cilia- and flagella-associated protein 184-like n=1 Tax=Mytilus edulis TaxID=6550 RepID=UPI0039EE7F85
MAEEFIILDPVVENCNVFQDQAIVVKDDGSLQLIHTGAPSSSQPTRLHSVPKRATVDKNKKGAEPNYVPFTASVEVNQQRPDLLAQYNEQLINNQKLYVEQQKAINELTKSVIEIKNAVLHKTADSIGPSAPTQLRNDKRGKSPNTFYDSVSEEESERDYESSQEDEEDHVAEEPPQKRIKVTTSMSKMEKMKKVENILSKKPRLGSPVHDEIAKIVNQGAESAVDHKNKEVQELVDKFVRPENCEFLEVPKVNKVLWSSKETSKRLKDNDRSLQRTQGYLVKGMIPVVQLMEKSLKSSSEESEETFELSLDSLNLLLYAHRDLSSQRRKLLTPALDKKYLALSHEDEKISPNYLFGDRENLEQRMKEIDDSTKLGNKMKVKSTWNKDKAHVPEVKDTYSRNDNFKSDNANGSFKGKSGFKNNFLAKKAQIRREQKKPYNKKGKGNLGH